VKAILKIYCIAHSFCSGASTYDVTHQPCQQKEEQMKTNHQTFSRLAFPLVALALSTAVAGAARANGIPTSTDEARALKYAAAPTQYAVPANQQVSSTDEARALAGHSKQAPISLAVKQAIAANADEGRAAAVGRDTYGRAVHTETAAAGLTATGSGGE
jgi:hypothetical protein